MCVENACHALLTAGLGNLDKVAGFGKLSAKKNLRKSRKSSYTYIHMKMQTYCNYTILIWMHPGRQNVHWPSVRFLPLSCSMLLRSDVEPLWRCSELIWTKINLRQHLFGPKSQNTIINSECKRLFSRDEGGTPIKDFIDCLWSPSEQSAKNVVGLLVPGSKIRRFTTVHQCPDDGAGCLRGQR